MERERKGDVRGDDELVRAAARGEADAFGVFYVRHVDALIAFFYRRTACPHTAADLAAESFAEALASVGRFRSGRGAARPWLFGIANNLYRHWCRRGRVADRYRQRLGIATPSLTDEDVERIEQMVDFQPMAVALTEALAGLSPQLREAIVLRVALDLPYEEVATELGCSVGAARVRVSRALAQLEVSMGAP